MSVTPDNRLGRLFAPDPRDYRLRAVHPLMQPPVERHNVLWPSFFKKFNQIGGTCVGHGIKEKTLISPVISTKRDGPPTPYEIYDWCIKADEFPDNDNDTARQMGTSVRAGMQYLQAHGYIDAYAFAFTIDDFIDGMMVDALVLGTNWYDSCWQCDDKTGLLAITPTAHVAGGHCYVCDEIDWKRGLAFGPQSWGYQFGKVNRLPQRLLQPRNGRWGMALETIERLLKEDGEAATGVEIHKPKAG
jgi:hypothetical protein